MKIEEVSNDSQLHKPLSGFTFWHWPYLVFRGFVFFFATFWLVMSLLICSGFLKDINPLAWVNYLGEVDTAKARVLKNESAGAVINNKAVMLIEYEFDHKGKTYKGESRYLGETPALVAEFPSSDPTTSRLVGTTENFMGWMVLFPLIFPAIGVGMIYFGIRRNLRAARILGGGALGEIRLIRKEPTEVTTNRQRNWQLLFEYEDALGEAQYVGLNTPAHVSFGTPGHKTAMVYLPHVPGVWVARSELPSALDISDSGEIEPVHMARVLPRLLFALIFLGGGIAGSIAILLS